MSGRRLWNKRQGPLAALICFGTLFPMVGQNLLWQNNSTRQVAVTYCAVTGMECQGAQWLHAGLEDGGWLLVAAADFDGNGVPDLVYMEDATRRLSVHFFGGAGGTQMQGWKWLNATGNPRWTAIVPR